MDQLYRDNALIGVQDKKIYLVEYISNIPMKKYETNLYIFNNQYIQCMFNKPISLNKNKGIYYRLAIKFKISKEFQNSGYDQKCKWHNCYQKMYSCSKWKCFRNINWFGYDIDKLYDINTSSLNIDAVTIMSKIPLHSFPHLAMILHF